MMKTNKFLLGIFAIAALAISCDDDEEDYVIPAMSVDKTELSFDETGGAGAAQSVYITSNRDWEVNCDADWVFFSPTSAKASDNSVEVSVYVDANTGTDRTAKLTFDGVTVSVTVTVSQTGPSGESYGDGTVSNPYTVSDALSIINAGSYTSKNVYVKGIISQIDEVDTGSYGNATYYISDDGTTDEHLEVYRGYSLGGAKFTSEDEIQVGDEVIVYGELTMYGTTPEVTQGSSIYYLNGVTADVGDVGDHELEGDGTVGNPYTALDAIWLANDGSYTSSNVYVKGIISQIDEIDTGSYGNATYYISDDGSTTNQFEIYRGYSLGGARFTAADEIQVGDEVIVYGVITMFYSTPEMTQGSSIYSLNGVTSEVGGGDDDYDGDYELVGDGTADNPYTAPDANWLANSGNYTEDEVYVTGIISKIDEISTSYGNATYYISDDGTTTEQFEIYRGYSLDGAKFTSSSEIEVGDKVVVLGVITMYYSTPEMTTGSKIVSLEKGEGNTGGDDEGEEEEEGDLVYGNDFDKSVVSSNTTITSSVTAYQNETGSGASDISYNWSSKMSVRVSNGSAGAYTNASGNNNIFFGAEDAGYFVIKNIALPSGETNYKLTFGAREDSNVFATGTFKLYVSQDNAAWVQLTYDFPSGNTSSSSWALASTTFTVPSGTSTLYIYYEADVQSVYRLDDMRLTVSSETGTSIDFSTGVELEGGDSIGGGEGGEDIVDATAAEVNSGTDGTTYRVAGYITSVASTTYGNFYLKDYTGETYIYGTLDANGNTKNWESLGISAGDIVKVHGPKSTYGSTAELVDVTVDEHYAVTDVTIAEFNAASVSTEVYYRLTGTVTSIASSTYGNLYLEDETGSVYVYGLPCGYGGSDNTFSSTGVAQGDVITIVGTRGVYNSTIEVLNGFYVETVSSGSSGGGSGSGDDDPYTQNVTWTLISSASNDKAVIGGETYDLLKLGTSSKVGSASCTVPAGTKALHFYCIAWNKGGPAPFTVTVGSTAYDSYTAIAHSGLANSTPYTIDDITDSDYFEITFDELSADTEVKVETTDSSYPRVGFVGFKYITE